MRAGIITDYYSETELYHCWAKEQPIRRQGMNYRVGKMSYGQYFLEPGEPQGETKPFNIGTLWLRLADAKERLYEIEED